MRDQINSPLNKIIDQDIFIYLGGNHQDSTPWRKEFADIINNRARKFTHNIFCIDPFHRQIDENDASEIVSRDIKILMDSRLKYVLLKSTDSNGSLSTGTASEMIIARSLGKPVVILVTPPKQNEELWTHPFVKQFANHVATDMQGAADWILHDLHSNIIHENLQDTIEKLTKYYTFPADTYHPFRKTIQKQHS